jgi:hypothetical protein
LIRQRNGVPSVPATLRRLLATAAFRRAHGGTTDGPHLNQRSFLRRVLGGVLRPVNEGWPQPYRASLAPVAWPVVREPESAWWEREEEYDDEAAVTVAVVGETAAGRSTDAVVSRLAELAVHDELLIVYGSGGQPKPGHHAVLAGLRGHLPRHHLITLHVDHHPGGLRRDAAAALQQLLEDGSVPLIVTPAVAVPGLTAEISSYLRADRVLRVAGTTTGADLHQVWRRRATADVN